MDFTRVNNSKNFTSMEIDDDDYDRIYRLLLLFA